jgi:catechol 2,3-dioxygenase-like lactoylglutathione lyase family enzyme
MSRAEEILCNQGKARWSNGSSTVFTKINHIAIISENYTASAKFYEVMFGMRTSPKTKTERAMSVGDGYVGLNINPRSTGRPARLDHFGVEVDDVEAVFARMRAAYPQIEWLHRPSSRPFAGITTHDIDGNVFDLSQRDMSNRAGLYAEASAGVNERHIDHVMLRTMHPLEVATFYHEVLGLENTPAASGDPCRYLTDGHVTLVIAPWSIADYAGTSITSPCVDHIGFRVGDVDAFLAHVEQVASENRQVAPYPVGSGPEGRARLDLARASCRLCTNYIADVETVLLGLRP